VPKDKRKQTTHKLHDVVIVIADYNDQGLDDVLLNYFWGYHILALYIKADILSDC
jgi:hypothetical protein